MNSRSKQMPRRKLFPNETSCLLLRRRPSYKIQNSRKRPRNCCFSIPRSSTIALSFLAAQSAAFLHPSSIQTLQCQRGNHAHIDSRAASLFVASPFTTSNSYFATNKRGLTYSHFNQDESMSSSPLTISPNEFEKKIASFSSNISRLRMKKKRELLIHETVNEDKTAASVTYIATTSDVKQLDDALINACNSFIYFLNDEAAKLSAFTATGEATLDDNIIASMRESLEMVFIQSIRAASEVGDFILLPKIVYAAVEYALAFVQYGKLQIMQSSDHIELGLLQPRIFGEAISSLAKTKASVSKIKGMWNYFIKDVARDNQMSAVLISQPSAYELNAMISALAGRGKVRAAIKLYREFAVEEGRVVEADAYTASVLFGILADSIDLGIGGHEVFKVEKYSNEKTSGENDYRGKSPCWQWNEAVELLDTFASHQLNNVAYASLLKVNEKATGAFLKNSAKHGGVPSAMMVLDRMKLDEISPDIVTCSVIMSTFDKGRHWRAAVSLLDAMQISSCAAKATEKWTLPSPNIFTYALAISTCARCDKSDAVLSLFDQMSTAQVNSLNATTAPYTWVYNKALSACVESCHSSNSRPSKGFNLATAMVILEKMEADTIGGGNSSPDVESYNSVLAMLGQRILLEAKKTKLRVGHETRRLSEFTSNDDIVNDILNTMRRQGIDRNAETYSNAIAACFSQPKEILTLFQMAVHELKYSDRGSVRQVANSALTAAASLGNMELVSSVLSILSQAGIKMDLESIKLVILALGKYGDCDSILALLICLRDQEFANTMLKDKYGMDILDNLPKKFIPVLDEEVYSAAITSCLKNDELAIADQILQSMKVKEISLTQKSLQGIIMEYCRMAMESSKEEYKAARIAKRNGVTNSQYPDLLEPVYFTSLARGKAALALLKAVNKPSHKLLATVTKACAAAGLWQDARSLLRRMHRAAIRELRERTSSTNFEGKFLSGLPQLHRYLLKFCAKGGHITPALNYADDIQYLAQQVRLHRKAFIHGNSTKSNLVSISSTLLSDDPKNDRIPQSGMAKTKVPQVLGRPIGLTGLDWKLLLIAAWRGGHWKVCVGTLPFISPYVKETHPKFSKEFSKEEDTKVRKPSLTTLNRKYSQLESAITAAVLCFEVRSQYAWAIRAIEDWIEWSGRRPPRQAAVAACRVLAKRYRGTEVLNLITKVLSMNDTHNTTISGDSLEYTYEKSLYVEAITALHQSGLYDDADYLYAEGERDGHLPSAVVRDISHDKLILDLHGMSSPVAHAAVRVSIQKEMMNMQKLDLSWSKDIIIITGQGKRSEEKFKPVLRPEVQRMLTEEFFPPIGSSTIPGNLGALLVGRGEVTNWLSHQQQAKGERLLMIADALRGISSGARLERAILSSGNRLEEALRRKLQNNSDENMNR